MIEKILKHHEFENKPPVLVDVGASGAIHPVWKDIASYCICIGFDADLRATNFVVSEDKGFKKLYILNKLISDEEKTLPFYLTESPYCSSTLEPNHYALKPYSFNSLFSVKRKIELPATNLKNVLASLNIEYVDWVKTDSQGTDLTVFKGFGQELISKVIVVEFEPGILNAYKGEDKMHSVMAFMEERNFWLCNLQLKGPVRISEEILTKYFSKQIHRNIDLLHKSTPFWGEMSYLSDMTNCQSKRDLLFGCVCALIHKQYGFCIELAQRGVTVYGDGLFEEIIQFSVNKITKKVNVYLRLRFFIRKIKKYMQLAGQL